MLDPNFSLTPPNVERPIALASTQSESNKLAQSTPTVIPKISAVSKNSFDQSDSKATSSPAKDSPKELLRLCKYQAKWNMGSKIKPKTPPLVSTEASSPVPTIDASIFSEDNAFESSDSSSSEDDAELPYGTFNAASESEKKQAPQQTEMPKVTEENGPINLVTAYIKNGTATLKFPVMKDFPIIDPDS